MDLFEKCDVVAVTRHAGDDPATDRSAEQKEVAHDVENLVPREFALEAELGVDDAVISDEDAIVQPTAAGETHLLQRGDVLQEAEGSRGRDLCSERFRPTVLVDDVLAPDGLRIFERIVDLETIR